MKSPEIRLPTYDRWPCRLESNSTESAKFSTNGTKKTNYPVSLIKMDQRPKGKSLKLHRSFKRKQRISNNTKSKPLKKKKGKLGSIQYST